MKSKLMVVLCLVLAGALVLGGCSDKIVASVNGVPIKYDKYVDYLTQMGISPDDAEATQDKADMVEYLVQEEALNQMLKDKGYLDLTDEQVAQAESDAKEILDSFVQYQYQAQIAEELGEDYTEEQHTAVLEKYNKQALEENGLTWEELLDSYKMQLALDAAREELTGDVVPTEEEIRAEYDKQLATDKEAMDADPSVYESAVNYGATVYYIPEGLRNVKQVLIKIDDKATEAISLLRQNAYDDQADALLEMALADIKAEAESVLEKINSGELTFDQAVEQFNDDTGMPEEGYMVCKNSTTYMESFTNGAMALAKLGDVSGLVKTDYGYHIIQYTSDVKSGEVGFDQLRDSVAQSLTATMQDEKWTAIVDEWNDKQDIKYFEDNY